MSLNESKQTITVRSCSGKTFTHVNVQSGVQYESGADVNNAINGTAPEANLFQLLLTKLKSKNLSETAIKFIKEEVPIARMYSLPVIPEYKTMLNLLDQPEYKDNVDFLISLLKEERAKYQEKTPFALAMKQMLSVD